MISTFKPECTLPPPGTNYVSGPNTRSTLSILWDCLSIILLCTWNIQHLNVPAIRPEAKSFWKRLWGRIVDTKTKVKWMILTILVPEYLVGRAFGEWLSVLSIVDGDRRWTMLRTYMANMGYFVLDIGEDSDSPQAALNTEDLASALSPSYKINLSRLCGRYWALDANQWDAAFLHGVADQELLSGASDQLPSQLAKFDKSGALVKALALLQVSYLVVQLIARKVAGLPSSQLEIAALAFAASSAVTYVLYWNRPQGVEVIQIIRAKPRDMWNYNKISQDNKIAQEPLKEARRQLAEHGPRYLWLGYRGDHHDGSVQGPIPIPNDASHYAHNFAGSNLLENNDEVAALAFGSVIGGVLFGGLHCLAWNFEFPTPAERTVWRVCAILTTALPVAAVVPLTVWIRLNPFYGQPELGRTRRVVGILIVLGFIIPYVLARLFIMVEVFRSLGYLPPEAYVETWSGSFPKWG